MRAWWGLALGVVVIGVSYIADVIVSGMIQAGRATFSSMHALALEAIVKVAIVALLVGLGWLVFRGPRSRPVGVAMALLGFAVALVPPFSLVVSFTFEIAVPTFVIEVGGYPTGYTLWAATAVLVLGIVEIVSPTRDPMGIVAEAELAGGPF